MIGQAVMNPQILQNLFSAYLVLAVGYNLLSLILVAKTGKRAAPTDPLTGILFMSVLYLIYSTEAQVSHGLYLFFLSTFTALIFSFGIVSHILNYDEAKYFSRITWMAAWVINTLGVLVLLLIIAAAF